MAHHAGLDKAVRASAKALGPAAVVQARSALWKRGTATIRLTTRSGGGDLFELLLDVR